MSTDMMKAPECQLWGFLVRYGEPLRSGCCCLFISVQPFTNIVASYTCQYRDKERNYVFHGHHLLSAGGLTAASLYHKFSPSTFFEKFISFSQNKLMTKNNCMMHPSLADKNGNSIISSSKLDRQKPLFGLVETCFDGMGYKDLKDSVVLEMKRISNILSQWLEIQSLSIKPL